MSHARTRIYFNQVKRRIVFEHLITIARNGYQFARVTGLIVNKCQW